MKKLCLIILISICINACALNPVEQEKAAGEVLNEYFSSLFTGSYDRAAELYGGSYEALEQMNPEVDPDDHSALLEQACKVNGFVCLRLKSSVLSAQPSEELFIFKVSFEAENGKAYERLPCCGDSTPGEAGRSEFEYSVVRGEDGQFRVMELPLMEP
jgi:hypothetical protein